MVQYRHLPFRVAKDWRDYLLRWAEGLSGIGLALGTLFFAAALTPTLVPRTYFTQGVVSGACFAAGYGLGILWRWLWVYLELPSPSDAIRRIANSLIAIICVSVAVTFLWKAAGWQNSIRTAMEMEPLESAHPFKVCVIGFATFVALLTFARLFKLVGGWLTARMRRFVPRRVANVLGVALATVLFWSIASDVFFRTAINVLDSSFKEFDALFESDRPQPTAVEKTGSPASLVSWSELGRTGREFIVSGPTAADISKHTGRAAVEPVRVYVGLGAEETPDERAALALEELKRVDAFERAVLVVITPTGTGWIDPAAMDTLEYLHDGDVASVALQYSYLSSPLSLIVEPEYGRDSARALFTAIYRYWTSLDPETRPELYLHGLSLGAMNSERSLELLEIIGDPIDGALWSGPPFESRMWRSLTNERNPDSPAWLPEFRDGSFVRFMNQDGSTVPGDRPWGPMRIVYLQYGSDAVVFFDYRDLYRKPAWMEAPLAHDVSPELRWYPVVTMLQLAIDMAMATTPPMGFGHVYAPQHYIDAWSAVTDVRNWSEEELDRLKIHLEERIEDPDGSADAYENRGG